jgi:hypothetical protein
MITMLLALLLALPLQDAPTPAAGGDAAAKLVERIQQDLGEVDKQLEQAADQQDPVAQIKAARDAHVRAISDLEELIKQVKYRKGGGGGGGGSSGKSSDGQSKGKPQPRGSDSRQQAEQAASPQEAKGQPQPAGAKPVSGRPTDASQAPVDGQQPPPQPVGDYLRQDTDARWGVLPPKLQERLMNLHTDDVPERYRAWLEAYVRELNRRDTATGP